jgi:hypothetical protein
MAISQDQITVCLPIHSADAEAVAVSYNALLGEAGAGIFGATAVAGTVAANESNATTAYIDFSRTLSMSSGPAFPAQARRDSRSVCSSHPYHRQRMGQRSAAQLPSVTLAL